MTSNTTTPSTAGELLYLNPNDIEIGANVRTEASVGSEFVASIATHGVLQPITAVRRTDGVIVCRDGQRRILAARAADVATMAVVVEPEPDDDATREIERIEHQFVANEDRTDLSAGQRLGAVEQMLNLGVTPSKTAKRLNLSRAEVDAASVTAKSTRAREEVTLGVLTLEQAAVLAEFEDVEADYDRLLRTATYSPGLFAHAAQQIRDRRDTDARRTDAGKVYAADGFTVLAARPVQLRPEGLQPLHWLTREDGETATPADITDPTQWAVYLSEASQLVAIGTGEPVDEDDVDWDTEDDADATAAEGLRHANTVENRAVFEAAYYCRDIDNVAELTGRDTSTLGSSPAAETEEDAERKREAAAAARRQTITNNKAARSADVVRAEWLRTLLTRKTPPTNAARWVATRLAVDPTVVSDYNARETAAELLGVTAGTLSSGDVTGNASETRAQVISLALVIGGYETRTRKQSWRASSYSAVDLYMAFLVELGYQLAPIEEVMAGTRAPDSVTLPD